MTSPSPATQKLPLVDRFKPRLSRKRCLVFAVVIAASFSLALWWNNHQRMANMEREFARRIQESDNRSQAAQLIAQQTQDQLSALRTQLGILDAKLGESQSQQLALEQLYQELSRNRDEWALTEIEQILAIAVQQLQLAGNVQGALIALQNADNRLARADKPQFIQLRRVLARDIERLKALPTIDLSGNALRLDTIIRMIDTLPLLADAQPSPRVRLDAAIAKHATSQANTIAPVPQASWWERTKQNLLYALAQAWEEFLQLIRIREVTHPDALILTPTQAYFVRENLKLRLLNARSALLVRQESTYRSDLINAQEMLQRYFDTRAKSTTTALEILKQVQASNTTIELPTLSESLSAVRNFKLPRERSSL